MKHDRRRPDAATPVPTAPASLARGGLTRRLEGHEDQGTGVMVDLGMVDIDDVGGHTRYCVVSLPCAGVSRKVAKSQSRKVAESLSR
jgi:hypothetical protein